MEENSDTEIEPYEEVVEQHDCRTPYNSRSTSPGTVVATSTDQSTFYGPIEFVGRVENFVSPSTELFAPAPRSALRQELAVSKEQRTAVVTDRGGFATLTSCNECLMLPPV